MQGLLVSFVLAVGMSSVAKAQTFTNDRDVKNWASQEINDAGKLLSTAIAGLAKTQQQFDAAFLMDPTTFQPKNPPPYDCRVELDSGLYLFVLDYEKLKSYNNEPYFNFLKPGNHAIYVVTCKVVGVQGRQPSGYFESAKLDTTNPNSWAFAQAATGYLASYLKALAALNNVVYRTDLTSQFFLGGGYLLMIQNGQAVVRNADDSLGLSFAKDAPINFADFAKKLKQILNQSSNTK